MGYLLKFKWNVKQNGNDYRRYTCEDYMHCGKKDTCTSAKGGRTVSRLKEEETIEMVDKNTREK